MLRGITAVAGRARVLTERALGRLGLGGQSVLLLLAVLVGVVTAAAAVGFHELIDRIRQWLYERPGPGLYRPWGLVLLVLLPAAGGLGVGLMSRYLIRGREGHGILDVMETVLRSRGVIRPRLAVEKILTSAVTIGSGGSAGAEGPIVQIGAAIASGVGQLFRVARPYMPVLIGCGSAAGISAIFNSPIGGVLFTLEVILQDFSARTLAPVVLASVIANVTTKAIFRAALGLPYDAIFALDPSAVLRIDIGWPQLPNFALLGLLCGLTGVALTRLMHLSEDRFGALRMPRVLKPALGGAMLGLLGVLFVVVFGWLLLGQDKPFDFGRYPLPAFYSDGYGVIKQLLDWHFYTQHAGGKLMLLLAFLGAAKIVGTCLTLASGGSGGIIAPSLFLGASSGGLLGLLLQRTGLFAGLQPNVYALVGMGAVLAAVVHAPLSAILILLDVTQDFRVLLPAMLASIVATGTAQLVFADSIYTLGLRRRGVQVGSLRDLNLLRRMTLEQVELEPAVSVSCSEPLARALEVLDRTGAGDLVVLDERGRYAGMLTGQDIQTALLQREAVPLLLAGEMVRAEVPLVRTGDDLASVLDCFSRHEVGRLPVCVSPHGGQVVGVISRTGLMNCYQRALEEH